jgi:uncharacterized membrane protein YbjE (DUF340 family)
MHAGNALAYPLIFLWFVGLNMKNFGLVSRQVVIWPLGLLLMFVLVNIPWSVVKASYFPDSHALIRQHYLPGCQGNNLLACFLDFNKKHPLAEQLTTRLNNLLVAARVEEILYSKRLISEGNYAKFIKVFNNYQFFYVIFCVVPLACVALAAKGISALITPHVEKWGDTSESKRLSGEMYTLLFLSCATIVGMILLNYREYPDINHQHPPGATLIICSLLIGITLQSGRVGWMMLGVYTLFSFWRIYMHSILYIFY